MEEFGERYEQREIPTVIRGVVEGEGWRAGDRWSDVFQWGSSSSNTADEEKKSYQSKLLTRSFKCGESDSGKTLRITLSDFLKYSRTNKDDSPLYIFDGSFDDDDTSKMLLDDYSPPRFFGRDDFFSLVGEERRPPYRWWLIGPERSGTTVHIDPLGTSAWNTLVVRRPSERAVRTPAGATT